MLRKIKNIAVLFYGATVRVIFAHFGIAHRPGSRPVCGLPLCGAAIVE